MDIYFEICKECEYLYHCFGRDIAMKIKNNDVNDMYLSTQNCMDFYPEIKQ